MVSQIDDFQIFVARFEFGVTVGGHGSGGKNAMKVVIEKFLINEGYIVVISSFRQQSRGGNMIRVLAHYRVYRYFYGY